MIRYSVHQNSTRHSDYYLMQIEIPENAINNENDKEYTKYFTNLDLGLYNTDRFYVKKIINLRFGNEIDKFFIYQKDKFYEKEYGRREYAKTYQRAIESIPFNILKTYSMENCFAESFCGVFNTYDKITTQIIETFYHINGFIEGEYIKYWNNTEKIKIICQFINGKLHGYFKDYDFNGNIIKEYLFDCGKIINSDKDYEILYQNNLINWGFI